MKKQNKIFLYIGLLIIGIVLTITGLINIIKPVVKYVDYTEDEIKQKARELGMVELKEFIELNTEKIESNKQSSNKTENESSHEIKNKKDNDSNQVANVESKNEKDNDSKEYVLFKVHKGERSEEIIDRLFKEGIINDKESFIKLVAKKNVGRYFVYGEFKLYKGMDYETIIKVLTGR
jgi:uncharacterized membrane protein YhiD involved in acid resistance